MDLFPGHCRPVSLTVAFDPSFCIGIDGQSQFRHGRKCKCLEKFAPLPTSTSLFRDAFGSLEPSTGVESGADTEQLLAEMPSPNRGFSPGANIEYHGFLPLLNAHARSKNSCRPPGVP